MAADVARIDVLQETMYAQGKHGLLCVFQAVDCGGKDGTIRKVFGAVDPIGIVSTSFKTPSDGRAGARLSVARASGRAAREAISASSTVRTTRTC